MKIVMKDIYMKVQYPQKLHELHNDLLFLPEKIKIENIEKLLSKLHNKK